METQLDLLVAWGFHKIMSLMVSLYVDVSVCAYKDEKWGSRYPLTKVSKKKCDSEVASIARDLNDPRRMESSAKALDRVYEIRFGLS